MNIYDYSVINAEGKEVSLKEYEGKVIMIVNTATECGFTPQYEDLQAIYRDLHGKGFEIIDIPCNQFGGQAPGSMKEISEFCSLHFHTEFPHMQKSDVNGPNALPLYSYLKSQKGFKGFGDGEASDEMNELLKGIDPDYEHNPEIKWNFTKFIIDREGKVVARFEPTVDMKEVRACIEGLL